VQDHKNNAALSADQRLYSSPQFADCASYLPEKPAVVRIVVSLIGT
jgi:hypothetical protein